MWGCSELSRPWGRGTKPWEPWWGPQLLMEAGQTQGFEQRGAWGCLRPELLVERKPREPGRWQAAVVTTGWGRW